MTRKQKQDELKEEIDWMHYYEDLLFGDLEYTEREEIQMHLDQHDQKIKALETELNTLVVGLKIAWYIRPEIQKEFGGYMESKRMTGRVISVHDKHVMVRHNNNERSLDNILTCQHMDYAVDKSNKSIKILS